MGVHRGRPSYEQLNECQWVLGILRQRQVAKSQIVRENMIEYLIDLLQDAIDFSFPAAKGAHFVLINRIIEGLASWEDLASVQKIRERYSKSNHNQNQSSMHHQNQNITHNHVSDNRFDRKRELKPVPCFKFNKRLGCTESRDHIHGNLLLKHSCQLCHQLSGNFENHSKINCPRNVHNVKNM